MEENKQILINYTKNGNNEILCLNTTNIKKVVNQVPAEFIAELESLINKYFE